MSTPFTDVYDRALTTFTDYKIDQLFNISEETATTYLEGFLMSAIPDFYNCVKSLSYDLTSKSFTSDLSDREKLILARLLSIQWMTKEIQDVTQMNLHLNDTDFKHYAESQNLKEKSDHRDKMREMVDGDIMRYGLLTTDWESWAKGDYTGSLNNVNI